MTFAACSARISDSLTALSPPPTIITSLPLKKPASQVAQYETPLPENSSSPGMPSLR